MSLVKKGISLLIALVILVDASALSHAPKGIAPRVAKAKSEDLLASATEVDSRAAELIRKQKAGFAHSKGGE